MGDHSMTFHPSLRVQHLTRHLVASSKPPAAPYRIRQVVWVVKDLEPSVGKLCQELLLAPTFRDHEIHLLGLTNCVCVVGDQFLEMVCPNDPSNTAGKQLQRRKGDGGYMVMLQTLDLEKDKERLLLRAEFQTVLQLDREEVNEIHLHPKDTAKCIVSFSQTPGVKDWPWGRPEWKHKAPASTQRCQSVRGVIIQADNISKVLKQYQKLLGVNPVKATDDEHSFYLTGLKDSSATQEIRIVKSNNDRGDGLSGLIIETTDPSIRGRATQIHGMDILFV